MVSPAEESPLVENAKLIVKDLVVGLAIGAGVYVLWVIGHSILFG